MAKGSPPRMRGKDSKGVSFLLYGRITPAYAGKRKIQCLQFIDLVDHPRVCGEKNFAFGIMLEDTGSPPRMRGKD